jgi:acetyl-CoA acyltransferase
MFARTTRAAIPHVIARRSGIARNSLVATTATNDNVSSGAAEKCFFSTQQNSKLFKSAADPVVVVGGVRIPFALTSSIYEDQLAVDLQRLAIQGLLTQTGLDKTLVDYVICGNVIQEVRTSNIAREAAINVGLPTTVGAHTIAQACISANAAICSGAEKILAGRADVVIAGGCETFSDVPIRLSRPIRQKLITSAKAIKKGGPLGFIRHMTKGLKMKDISLETPAIANYTTGEVMGVSSDRLAAKFGVSRADQDEFAVRSHVNAAAAHSDGFYLNDVIPYKGSTTENGIKSDSTVESVSKLKPAFVKPHGTHTAANSSFLTDGAAATLLMSESRAKELGFKPWAYIRDWSFRACDPFEELLLGPTYCSYEILERNNLNLESDIGVFEIHEAFAGQILSNLVAMNSESFAKEKFNRSTKIGEVPLDKVNTKGGSLALGHPFGATGSRLVTTASKRLQQEQQRFALLAACADGGMGHACLLERYDG